MYIINNPANPTGEWLLSYEGGAVWTAERSEAMQFATLAEAQAVCTAIGTCTDHIEEA